MAGCPVGSLTLDKTLTMGYLGTSLTASLCLDAHLQRTKEQVKKIGTALARPPLPPHIKQRLLIYGTHSRIAHTYCLVALSRDAMKAVDSLLERLSRKIWGLPTSFPRAGQPNRGNWTQHPIDMGRLISVERRSGLGHKFSMTKGP